MPIIFSKLLHSDYRALRAVAQFVAGQIRSFYPKKRKPIASDAVLYGESRRLLAVAGVIAHAGGPNFGSAHGRGIRSAVGGPARAQGDRNARSIRASIFVSGTPRRLQICTAQCLAMQNQGSCWGPENTVLGFARSYKNRLRCFDHGFAKVEVRHERDSIAQ